MTGPVPDAPAAEGQPVRPGLAIRVGVTGARRIAVAERARVTAEVRAALELVKAEMLILSGHKRAAASYAGDADGVVRPVLRLISPLAEGADRLVADVALDLGYRLEVAMPFERAEYAKDFAPKDRDPAESAASLAAFDHLVARAGECALAGVPRVLELDGGRDDDDSASYAAVGRLVVRNCDLLIAIWSGRPGEGPGGTADTVRFAARSGPPVWWVHSGEGLQAPGPAPPPTWIETSGQLRRPHAAPAGIAAEAMARRYLHAIVVPPKPAKPVREGVLGRICRRAQDPLPRYLGETLPVGRAGSTWLWKSEKRVMAAAAYAGARIERWLGWGEVWLLRRWDGCRGLFTRTKPPRRPDAVDETVPIVKTPGTKDKAHWVGTVGAGPGGYWDRFFRTPDELAVGYGARYRSCYALVTLGAAVALIAAGLHHAYQPAGRVLAVGELLALVMVFAFVAVSQWHHWHERWISYRLLAELFRKQQVLGMLGWSLPLGETWRVARGQDGATEGQVEGGPEGSLGRDAGVGWYFHAALRAAPLPAGHLGGTGLNRVRDAVLALLISGQIKYHEDRAAECLLQSRGLAGWGEIFLILTFVCVLLKAVLMLFCDGHWAEHAVHWLEIGAQLLVVPSAAFVALRVYAELELLAETNSAMAAMMKAVKARLAAFDGTEKRPLPHPVTGKPVALAMVSQEVGGAVHEVALDMLAETEGWARLFNVKEVGPG